MDDWELQPARDHGLSIGDRARSVRRERGLMDTAAHALWSAGVHFYLRSFHRLTATGRQHIPVDGPFVLAANHASHLDTLVLASAVPWRRRPSVYAVAAGDTFFASPLTGLLSAFVLNALPVWRQRAGARALRDLRARLVEDNCGYILFPEGTRTRTGAIGRFKPGLGMLVAGTAVPVIPCRLAGTFEALPHDRRWPRPAAIRLCIGPPIRFAELGHDREGWQAVADETAAAVGSLPG